jgi:hypothetical protein
VIRGGNIKYYQGLMAQEVQIPGVVVIARVQRYGVASHCFKPVMNGPSNDFVSFILLLSYFITMK